MTKHAPSPKQRRHQIINRAIQLPPPPTRRLMPNEVGSIMKRARKLGRQNVLTPYDHRVLDALLFQCSNPVSGAVVVSYAALGRVTGIARATVIKAIAKLLSCGLLSKIKRRLRVAWHQGGTASLQAPNAYSFNVPAPSHTGSAAQAVNKTLEISFISSQVSAEVEAAQAALAAIATRHERKRQAENRERVASALQSGRFVAR